MRQQNNIYHEGSEQNAAETQKKILAKVGTITDVVVTIGAFVLRAPILQQSLEELKKVWHCSTTLSCFLFSGCGFKVREL